MSNEVFRVGHLVRAKEGGRQREVVAKVGDRVRTISAKIEGEIIGIDDDWIWLKTSTGGRSSRRLSDVELMGPQVTITMDADVASFLEDSLSTSIKNGFLSNEKATPALDAVKNRRPA